MKKILVALGALLAATSLASAAVYSTNLTLSASTVTLLSTDRASVYSVELSSSGAGLVEFFDCDSVALPFAGTNYTNASYVSRTVYPTNYVTSYVGYNGYTNWYTNAGLWTVTTTNAGTTNALSPQLAFATAAGVLGVYNTDALFVRGICVRASTNIAIVLNYKNAK